MSQANSDFLHGGLPAAPNGLPLQGNAGLAEILQSISGSRRSGQLTFRSGASYGYVFLQQGRSSMPWPARWRERKPSI